MTEARQGTAELLASLRLHLVTDRLQCGARGLDSVVAAAVQGGVTCVQVRAGA